MVYAFAVLFCLARQYFQAFSNFFAFAASAWVSTSLRTEQSRFSDFRRLALSDRSRFSACITRCRDQCMMAPLRRRLSPGALLPLWTKTAPTVPLLVPPDWNGHFPEWTSREPVPLRTQLIVLHAVRPTSFTGCFGPKFSANADNKPPTQSAATAQQMRLSAPRNISSLKLRQIPCLNILALSAFLISKNP